MMSIDDDVSETFLTAIKLSLLRHCVMPRDDEALCETFSEEMKELLTNPNKNMINGICKSMIEQYNTIITLKTNRLLSFVKHIQTLGLDVMDKYQQISNLQARWISAYEKILKHDLNIRKITPEQLTDGTLLDDLNDIFSDAVSINNEIRSFELELSKCAADNIRVILKSSHMNQVGLLEALLDDPCKPTS